MQYLNKLRLAIMMAALTGLLSTASGLTIPANTADAMVRDHQTAGVGITNQTLASLRAGRFGSNQNMVVVLPFLMPDHGANPTPFSNATLNVNFSINAGTAYNVDLYGIDARTGVNPVIADFHFAVGNDTAANATKLQDDIIIPSTTAGALASNDLSAWLNAQYATGANAGQYVFLRFTPVLSGAFPGGTDGYMISSADNATAANQPFIDYTLDTSGITYEDVDITYGSNGTGTSSGATVSVLTGGTFDLDIDADPYYHIDEVLLNGSPIPFASEFTSPVIAATTGTANQALHVTFAPNVNFFNVPDQWLATHDPSSTTYDPNNLIDTQSPGMSLLLQSALADIDGDGKTAWEEYRDGTDPTDPNSYFCIYMGNDLSGNLAANIDTVSTGLSSIERYYTLQQSPCLTSGSWTNVPAISGLPATGSTVSHPAPASTTDKEFYRANVELVETTPRPPNIIMILTDDQGWGDLAFKGHPYLKTPHLDRLAQEGTVFDNFYVGNPTCSPARAGFMTGRFPAELQIHTAFKPTTAANQAVNNRQIDYLPTPGPDNLPNVASVLQAAGYATAHYGKWHLGGTPGAPAISTYGFDHDLTGNGPPGSPSLNESKYWDTVPASHKSTYNRNSNTYAMVHETAKFIEEHRDQPFYINIWSNLPHTELNPTPEQLSEYNFLVDPTDPDFIQVKPSDFVGAGPFFTQYMNEVDVPHPNGGTFAGKRELWNLEEQMQIYCASITPIDDALGVLLDKLEELGLAGNTIIMFTSDNGPEDYDVGKAENGGLGYSGPFRARKRSLYEGGIRVPCIVRWPEKVAMGKVDTESIWSSADWFPTMLSLAGVPMPAGTALSGEDVSGMLLGTSTTRTTPLIWEYRNNVFHEQNNGWDPPRFAIREGDYKLLTEENGTGTELYHLVNDPTESTNLINNAAHNSVAPAMKAKVMAWKATLPGPRN